MTPFKSEAQRRKIRELEDAGKVPSGTYDRWASETQEGEELPERVERASKKGAAKPGKIWPV
jgi:hypothetical protein